MTVTAETFNDVLAACTSQRERVEAASSLEEANVRRALAYLERQRAHPAWMVFTEQQRAELVEEFDRFERALRNHLEN